MFKGTGFGKQVEVAGEVVFNTGMVGYPESLTDPSYSGEILLQTYPLIGNYGVPPYSTVDSFGVPIHFESDRVQVTGYAVAELQEEPSHWSNSKALGTWLAEQGIPGIEGIDTRDLTKRLRTKGTMLGVLIAGDGVEPDEAREKARHIEDPNSRDLVKGVTVPGSFEYKGASQATVVVIDCGMKYGILRALLARGVSVVRVPYDSSPEEVMGFNPAGILVSNGPGDPKKCAKTIQTVRALLEGKVPIMGICLGNQIIALAAGADTYKLTFGHRGQNQPCTELRTGRCYITSQNHGYAVRPESLEGTGFEASFMNANDRTVEGIRHGSKPVFGVQFHPEASPGPYETDYIFDEFLKEALGC